MTSNTNSQNLQAFRWVLIAAGVAITFATLWAIRSILLLTLASVVLVVLVTMPVRFLARYNVRRGPAIALSLTVMTGVVLLLGRVMLPELIEQFNTLTTEILPEGVVQLIQSINEAELLAPAPFPYHIFDHAASHNPSRWVMLIAQPLAYPDSFLYESLRPIIESVRVDADLVNEVARQIATAIGQIGVSVLPFVGDVASTVLSVLIVIFLSLYFLIDPGGYAEGMIRLFPMWYRERARAIMSQMYDSVRGWLEGTFISMIFVGVASWLGLSLLQLEQAAALGVLAGLLSFVPNFGQLVAVIAAIVVGVVQAPSSVGWIIVVIYGTSFVQSQVFTPLLFGQSIRIPPVLVLLGQIVCGSLFGFLGILLAVPITAIFQILVREVYVRDVLGDRSEARDSSRKQRHDPSTAADDGSELVADTA
ncbi:MAG: AI-2E family transporter [Anaerolineae bacterium]|nr:AI-2E family transporter [Anaerolineae bacterium]